METSQIEQILRYLCEELGEFDIAVFKKWADAKTLKLFQSLSEE